MSPEIPVEHDGDAPIKTVVCVQLIPPASFAAVAFASGLQDTMLSQQMIRPGKKWSSCEVLRGVQARCRSPLIDREHKRYDL